MDGACLRAYLPLALWRRLEDAVSVVLLQAAMQRQEHGLVSVDLERLVRELDGPVDLLLARQEHQDVTGLRAAVHLHGLQAAQPGTTARRSSSTTRQGEVNALMRRVWQVSSFIDALVTLRAAAAT